MQFTFVTGHIQELDEEFILLSYEKDVEFDIFTSLSLLNSTKLLVTN